MTENVEPPSSSPIGKLIVRINSFGRKIILDSSLSEILNTFAKHLKESDDYLIQGIVSINFNEAALFLQSSSLLYAKNVDLLWDSVLDYQQRNLQYEKKDEDSSIKNSKEKEMLEERRQRYKRKRRIDQVAQESVKQQQSPARIKPIS